MDPAKRGKRVGGSLVAAIMGVDDFLDEHAAWVEIMGDGPPREPDDRMAQGKLLEPALGPLYTHLTKREVVYFDETIIDPVREYMAYTPDGICAGERRGVEFKVVWPDQAFKWFYGVPDRVRLQCAYYMAGLDYTRWDVLALVGGVARIYHEERDLELEDYILGRVERWWRRHVLFGEMPPITGSHASSRWLQHKYPKDKRPDLVEPNELQLDLFRQYKQIRERFDVVKESREVLENRLKLSLGDHEGLKLPGGDKFTWKLAKDSFEVDWESMGWALLTYYIDDEEARKKLIAEYTKTKKGVRKIYFRSKNSSEAEAA